MVTTLVDTVFREPTVDSEMVVEVLPQPCCLLCRRDRHSRSPQSGPRRCSRLASSGGSPDRTRLSPKSPQNGIFAEKAGDFPQPPPQLRKVGVQRQNRMREKPGFPAYTRVSW